MKKAGFQTYISEKAVDLADKGMGYTFEVDSSWTKPRIAREVASHYGVKVDGIRTMIMHSPEKVRGRYRTRKPNWKKAIVTLAEGNKIDFLKGN